MEFIMRYAIILTMFILASCSFINKSRKPSSLITDKEYLEQVHKTLSNQLLRSGEVNPDKKAEIYKLIERIEFDSQVRLFEDAFERGIFRADILKVMLSMTQDSDLVKYEKWNNIFYDFNDDQVKQAIQVIISDDFDIENDTFRQYYFEALKEKRIKVVNATFEIVGTKKRDRTWNRSLLYAMEDFLSFSFEGFSDEQFNYVTAQLPKIKTQAQLQYLVSYAPLPKSLRSTYEKYLEKDLSYFHDRHFILSYINISQKYGFKAEDSIIESFINLEDSERQQIRNLARILNTDLYLNPNSNRYSTDEIKAYFRNLVDLYKNGPWYIGIEVNEFLSTLLEQGEIPNDNIFKILRYTSGSNKNLLKEINKMIAKNEIQISSSEASVLLKILKRNDPVLSEQTRALLMQGYKVEDIKNINNTIQIFKNFVTQMEKKHDIEIPSLNQASAVYLDFLNKSAPSIVNKDRIRIMNNIISKMSSETDNKLLRIYIRYLTIMANADNFLFGNSTLNDLDYFYNNIIPVMKKYPNLDLETMIRSSDFKEIIRVLSNPESTEKLAYHIIDNGFARSTLTREYGSYGVHLYLDQYMRDYNINSAQRDVLEESLELFHAEINSASFGIRFSRPYYIGIFLEFDVERQSLIRKAIRSGVSLNDAVIEIQKLKDSTVSALNDDFFQLVKDTYHYQLITQSIVLTDSGVSNGATKELKIFLRENLEAFNLLISAQKGYHLNGSLFRNKDWYKKSPSLTIRDCRAVLRAFFIRN